MEDLPLHLGYFLTRMALIPMPVEVLGDDAELDDQVAGQVLGLDLAALFLPQPHKGRLIVAHDDPGVGAADKRLAINGLSKAKIHKTLINDVVFRWKWLND